MSASVNPDIVTDGLVLCLDAANPKSYPGTGTTWYDLSGTGDTSTLTNGPGFDSANNGSITFDGVDDYVLTSNSYALGLNPFAIDIWLKRVGDPIVNASLFASNATQTETNYQLAFNANGTIRMAIGTTVTTCGFIPDSTWTHYCFSRESATSTGGKSYINGVLDRTVDTSADLSQLITYRIGRNRAGTTYYNGYIASIKFYHNKSLTPEEVKQNFAAVRGRYGV